MSEWVPCAAGAQPDLTAEPREAGTRADVALDSSVVLDVSGVWVNDQLAARGIGGPSAPVSIDGGTLSLRALGDVIAPQGSVLDVSAGRVDHAHGDRRNARAKLRAKRRASRLQPRRTCRRGAGAGDIANGIHCADFVEVHFFDRDSVNSSLRLREMLKHRDRVLF